MWQLKHQGWANRFVLDAVAERSRPPRIKAHRATGATSKRAALSPVFRSGLPRQLTTIIQNANEKLSRPAGRIKIVDGKLQTASTLVALAGTASARDLIAAWLAEQLHLPLYRVDLGARIDEDLIKAERTIARLFKAAARCDVVLYLDHADVLFGASNGRAKLSYVKTRLMNNLLEQITLGRGLVLLAVAGRKKIDPVWVHYVDRFIDV